MSSLQYWPSMEPRECVAEAMNRVTEYYKYVNQEGYRYVWQLIWMFQHSATERNTLSTSVGEYAELQQVTVNDFRNLLGHKAGIIKNQKAVWEPMAINSDVKSLAQTQIAKNLLDTYFNSPSKNYNKKMDDMVNSTVSFGESFALQLWDGTRGKLTHTLPHPSKTNEDGTPQPVNFYEGDVDCRIYQPIDVIRDPYVVNQDQNHWYIFRDRMNKWDLAAKHPELYNEIVSKKLQTTYEEYYTSVTPYQTSPDLITVYTFVHKKSASLPNGRIIQYIDSDTILSSTEMNYDDFPVHRMIDSPIPGKNFSYTDSFDLLQISDLYNGLISMVITNQRMFGVQNIIMPKGSDISEMDLMGNMNLITYDPQLGGKPEPLNLCMTPAEVFKTMEILQQLKNLVVGVNSTAQGTPPTGVTAGIAISMLQSLNVQYNQGTQASYLNVMTSIGTAFINIAKQNMKTERLIEFTGKSSRSILKEFTGSDVSSISRVMAVPGNPLSQTIQGKYAIASELVQKGLITNVSEYLEVLETGDLNVMTDVNQTQALYTQEENEELRNGNPVQVSPFDDHIGHMRSHIGILSDLSVRAGKVTMMADPANPGQQVASTDPNSNQEGQNIIKVVQDHIMDHYKYATDPKYIGLLQMVGYKTGNPQTSPGAGLPGAPAPAAGAMPAPPNAVPVNAPPKNALTPTPQNGSTPLSQSAGGAAATAATQPQAPTVAPAAALAQTIQPKG